jgi:lipopolysaccharide transport system permease protein
MNTYKKIITPYPDTFKEYVQKTYLFRSLITTYAERDLKIKYAQTWLGLGWSVLQPTISVTIYTVIFNVLLNVQVEDSNYILFVLSGILCWNLFVSIFNTGCNSLMNNQATIKKMALPKIIFPLSQVLVSLVEFAIIFIMLVIAFLIWGGNISYKVLLLPLPILGLILFAVSLALIVLTYSVKRRDLLHFAPIAVQFSIWLTPVFFPVYIIPQQYTKYLYLNPVASMIDFFRWTMNIQKTFSPMFFVTLALVVVLFLFSVYLFKNKEDKFVDYL